MLPAGGGILHGLHWTYGLVDLRYGNLRRALVVMLQNEKACVKSAGGICSDLLSCLKGKRRITSRLRACMQGVCSLHLAYADRRRGEALDVLDWKRVIRR